jgi:anti-sigma regulatory factor (Ser/Thr protein kinase)
VLHEALRHVDQVAFRLARGATEDERSVVLAQLGELRNLLSSAAFQEAVLPDGRAAPEGDDGGGPALIRRLLFDEDLVASSEARSFTRSTCDEWRVPTAARNAAVDLASELVSNAARHAGGPLELAVERRKRFVVVTVADGSPAPPCLLPYRPGVSEQGIGLRIVDQLSESWGWVAEGQGKRVWARAVLSRDVEPSPAGGLGGRADAGWRPPGRSAARTAPNGRDEVQDSSATGLAPWTEDSQ